MTATVRELLGRGGAIARRLADFEVRPQQVELAEAIERALQERRHLCAEAGTGVGKSFAYLLPLALWADAHQGQGPVVVSTRTIALQEQLERKDLPFLHAVLPFEWSSVTAVGRNNYLCLRRMHLAEREQHLLADPVRHDQLRKIVDWSLTSRDGTRMDLPFPPLPEVWEEVQAEHGNCLQRACKHYDACGWQRARRRAESAQVLVVNHALYFADLALRMAGATFLPAHRVVVFDEAHHLERVATESLGLRLAASTVGWHLRRLHPRRSDRSLLARHGSPHARLLVEELRLQNDAFFAELQERLRGRRDGRALGDEVLPEPLSAILTLLAQELAACAMRTESVDVRMELQARSNGLAALAGVIAALCNPRQQDATPLVRWIEPGRHGALLCGAPLDVSATLRRHLFQNGPTAVLTSATLGPGDDHDFAWMRGQLGLDGDRVSTLRLGSPFDYRRAVALRVAEGMPDPGTAPASYRDEAALRTRDAVLDNGGRALVLCTSWDFVRHFAEQLRPDLEAAGIPLLVQGEAPLARLLEQKRAAPTSVLIGTDSLWEGIDVRGDALTLVVVTRLPFQNPGHPLTQARMQAIADRGGDPFRDWSLPEAILRFRQGFGRLIRSQQDRGRVLVLDPRVRTKAYGRRFLASIEAGADES
ncbi:MAG: ATP-dependent DNA helicase [Planctomycetota bacterium]